MKSLLVLSAVLSVSAIAVPIGTCVPGAMSKYIGNPCARGDQVFSSFAYSGNGDAANFNVNFQSVRAEYHLLLASAIGAGFLTTAPLSDRSTGEPGVTPGISSNVRSAIDQILADFSSTPGPAGQPGVVDDPGPAINLVSHDETGGPAFSADADSVTTTSTVAAVVPESATIIMIGSGLLCFALLRRRMGLRLLVN